MSDKEDFQRDTSDYELDKLLARRFRALHNAFASDSRDGVYAISLRYKGGGYWQGVIKRIRSDGGGLEVVFGRGGTITRAIRDLNAALSNGAWHPDKPWRPE